jgi:ATP/maltotriose-dependent transcriptional regulator MalT
MMLFRELEDQQGLSDTLNDLVRAMVVAGQATKAAALAEESLALARALDNGPDLTAALYWVAVIQLFQGDAERAVALLEESLALARERGDKKLIVDAQFTLGGLALYRGELVQAETYVQEALALSRELGDKNRTARALAHLGEIKRRQGDLTQARAVCTEGVLLPGEAGHRYAMGWNLIGLAKVAADEGQSEQAARLFGAAEAWLHPDSMDPLERSDYERAVEDVRGRLGEKVFATAWTQGRTLSPDQVLAALEPAMMVTTSPTETSSTPSAKAPTIYPGGLTARQVEILRLVAQGLTDAQIAERLVVSPRTVNWHLTTIYSKLQVSSRSAATRYAIEHHLV